MSIVRLHAPTGPEQESCREEVAGEGVAARKQKNEGQLPQQQNQQHRPFSTWDGWIQVYLRGDQDHGYNDRQTSDDRLGGTISHDDMHFTR